MLRPAVSDAPFALPEIVNVPHGLFPLVQVACPRMGVQPEC
jgi:hypothetical protein